MNGSEWTQDERRELLGVLSRIATGVESLRDQVEHIASAAEHVAGVADDVAAAQADPFHAVRKAEQKHRERDRIASEGDAGASVLHFTDGQSFDTSGPRRIVSRPDGLYVIGDGIMLPIDSLQEGREILASDEPRTPLVDVSVEWLDESHAAIRWEVDERVSGEGSVRIETVEGGQVARWTITRWTRTIRTGTYPDEPRPLLVCYQHEREALTEAVRGIVAEQVADAV